MECADGNVFRVFLLCNFERKCCAFLFFSFSRKSYPKDDKLSERRCEILEFKDSRQDSPFKKRRRKRKEYSRIFEDNARIEFYRNRARFRRFALEKRL